MSAKRIISIGKPVNSGPTGNYGIYFPQDDEVAVVNLRITPFSDPVTVPFTLKLRDSVQETEFPIPHLPRETVEIISILCPPGGLISANAQPYSVRADGVSIAIPPGQLVGTIGGTKSFRMRPPISSSRNIMFTTPPTKGAEMDEFTAGKAAEAASVWLELKEKTTGVVVKIMEGRKIKQETKIRRKIMIPPNTEVTCVTSGYVDVFYQWLLVGMQQKRF